MAGRAMIRQIPFVMLQQRKYLCICSLEPSLILAGTALIAIGGLAGVGGPRPAQRRQADPRRGRVALARQYYLSRLRAPLYSCTSIQVRGRKASNLSE